MTKLQAIKGEPGFSLLLFHTLSSYRAAVGYLWLGSSLGGVILALIIGGIYAFSMIFQSTEVVMRMNGAREVTEEQTPQLYHIVQDMAMVAQIPMPRVYIVDDPSMNAFATGSNPQNAAVAATTGLLAVMNREELEGVIGHEVSHIRNYDIRISTIAVALASAITMLSSIGGRMMWWGGGRSRDDDREGSGGLEIVMLILSPACHRFSAISSDLGPVSHLSSTGVLSRRFQCRIDTESSRDDQCFVKARQ